MIGKGDGHFVSGHYPLSLQASQSTIKHNKMQMSNSKKKYGCDFNGIKL